MDDTWDISEGVLRGRRSANGEWEFFLFVTYHEDVEPEQFPLAASSLSEARRKASQTEVRELARYIQQREHFHSQNSFNEGGWVGDLIDGEVGQFLIDEFDLDPSNLTISQLSQLDWDILSIGNSTLTLAKQQAKADLKETRRLIEQFKKQRTGIEKLSRGFRATANFSPFAAPDATLAQLVFELCENEKAIQENLDGLGRDKSNISNIRLCENAIDLFLRWYECPEEICERGLSYTKNLKKLKVLTKNEPVEDLNIPARLSGPLGEYLEKLKVSLLASGLEIWGFNVHEPSRIALAQHALRHKFIR